MVPWQPPYRVGCHIIHHLQYIRNIKCYTVLGFIEYDEKQKSSLFPELHESRDGKGQIVSKWYNRYRRSVGLTKKRNQDFHCYRHTVATNLAKQGVASTTISQILGHETASGQRATTTEAVYIKPCLSYQLMSAG